MDTLQAELEADHPELDIQILGVSERGQEPANSLMTDGRSAPWLQDVDSNNDGHSDVWTEWDVVYRDVVIVDRENTELGAFNLTTYNLADPNTYGALREILIDVATDQPFWQNRDNHLDVNKDGIISAQGDVLPCINELNNHFLTDSFGHLPALRLPPLAGEPYIDVNGDGMTTAQADVLPLINFLNNSANAEGEFATVTGSNLPPAALSIPAAAPASGPGVVTLDSRMENVSAQFVVPSFAPDFEPSVPPSASARIVLAATADRRDVGSISASTRTLLQDGREREVEDDIDDLDDLDELAAAVAAVRSLP